MRIVFMGTPEAAVPTLQRCITDGHNVVAVWTQPDRPAGRGNKLSASPVKEFALAHDLPVHQPTRIKNEEALSLFQSHNADLAVVVAYGRILPETFLNTPSRGCVNVHFSLLPAYRGAAPVNWAIVNGESETGVTTMFIEPTLDTGPILLQRRTPIESQETAPELMHRLSILGADLLSETLEKFDHLAPEPQVNQDATFAPILKREDGFIDWTRTAVEIERRIRGFQPWPNAHTLFESRRLTIWKAEVTSDASAGPAAGEPGEIITAHGGDIIVSCGRDTTLRLLEVQPEAKRKMSVRDFLNGTQVKIGDRLGTT